MPVKKPTEEDTIPSNVTPRQIVFRLPAEIEIHPERNKRFGSYKEADLADLLQDLDAGIGIEYPVKTRKIPGTANAIELVAGYRRCAAVALWNSRHKPSQAIKIPCLITTLNDEEAAEANVRENIHRHELTPMDCAVGIREFRNIGCSTEQIQKIYGRSEAWITTTTKLLQLDRKTQERVHRREIKAKVGMILADMSPEDRAVVIAAHDHDRIRFTETSVLKTARQCGAVSDGKEVAGKAGAAPSESAEGEANSADTDGAAPSAVRPRTPKRQSRTLKELVDYIEGFKFSPTINEQGQRLMNALYAMIHGKLSDDDMNKLLWELFPTKKEEKVYAKI